MLGLLCLAGVSLALACSDDDDGNGGNGGGVLRAQVGVVQSLSGPADLYGRSVVNGIELAMLEIKESEPDVDLTMLVRDDQSTVEGGRAAFEAMEEGGVAAIIGPTLSNVALEAMPLAQDAGIPVLGATTTAQGIVEVGDYVFRVALTEAIVVPATVERVNEISPFSTAVLVYEGSDAFSRSSADAMRDGVAKIGASIVAEVDVSQRDIDDALAEIDSGEVDAFLVTPLVEQAGPIVEAVRAAGFDGLLIGGNSFNTLAISGASGEAVEGAYVGAAWNPALERGPSQDFVAAYSERYGSAPDLFAAQGYSAVYVLLDALKRAGSTQGEALRDALAETSGVETPLGTLSFNERREALHEPVVQRFEGGKLMVVE